MPPKQGKGKKGPRKNAISRWYKPDDEKLPFKGRKTPKPTRLRRNITPGTVLILLSGRFRGKRVVFLK